MKLFGNWRKEPEHSEQTPFVADNSSKVRLESAKGAAFGQNRKILVVDDNGVVLKAFELKLKALGFKVLTATDGSGAVSLARQERPDLIVLDINFVFGWCTSGEIFEYH